MTKHADTKPLRAELEKARDAEEVASVRELLEREQPELERVLPEHVSAEAFTRSVLAELRRSPLLYDCEPEQIVSAMLLATQLGLEPGPLGLVYLVPAAPAVEFVIGYRGYLDLAYRSGYVKDVSASLVYAGEPFTWRKGTRPFLDHEPQLRDGPRETVAAYAVARLRTGGTVFEVIGPAEWEAARHASERGSKLDGPWNTDRGAMIRKTAVRRLEPMLPKTALLTEATRRDESPAPPLSDLADTEATL